MMRSTFFGLNTAYSGLQTQRRLLDTTAHNVANVSTPGYTRQRVEIQATPAWPVPGLNRPAGAGQLGTGVEAIDHIRLRDQFADIQFRETNSSYGEWQARAETLEPLDTLLGEPGGAGLSDLLTAYWDSWQALSNQPESAAARESVRRAGEELAFGFNDMDAELVRIEAEADSRIANGVVHVNELAGQINALNVEIGRLVQVGLTPNDLLDQRDVLIDELSEYVDITVTEPGTDMQVTIAVNGGGGPIATPLVDSVAGVVSPLAIDAAGNATVGGVPGGGIALDSGRLKGLVDARETVIPGYRATLDTLAADIVAQVNAVHSAGYGLDGVTGRDFFDPAGVTAATIALDAALAGSTDVLAASATAGDVPGGSDNAIALAQLQFDSHLIGGQTTTIDGFHASWVSQVGLDVDQAMRMAELQQGVLDGATERRDRVGGVNLDEEITDMLRFQESYNAAARMMTTMDEMLETIVSRMGVVGR